MENNPCKNPDCDCDPCTCYPECKCGYLTED